MNTGNGNLAGLTIDLDEEAPARPALPIVDEAGAGVVDEDGETVGGIPVRAVRNADGSIMLPLLYPVTLSIRSAQSGIRTETYKELTFHRLTGADMRALSAASKESQPSVMLARSTRMREMVMAALFDRMDGADIQDASLVVESFFGSGRKSGRPT